MKTLYESVLDDFDVFSDRADQMAKNDVLQRLKEELSANDNWKRWRIPNGAFGVKHDGDVLIIDVAGRTLYVDKDILEIISKYKNTIGFKKLRTNTSLHLAGVSNVNELFEEIECRDLKLTRMRGLENMHIKTRDRSTISADLSLDKPMVLKNMIIESCGPAGHVMFDIVPILENTELKNVERITVYDPKLWHNKSNFETLDKIFDTRAKMNIKSYTGIVQKACTARNIKAVATGLDGGKYKHDWVLDDHARLGRTYRSYLIFSERSKVTDIIDISKSPSVDQIQFRDDKVSFSFLKHPKSTSGNSLSGTTSDGWYLSVL